MAADPHYFLQMESYKSEHWDNTANATLEHEME